MKTLLLTLFTLLNTTLPFKTNLSTNSTMIKLDTQNQVIWAKGVDNFKVNGVDSEFICYPETHGDITYHEYYTEYEPNRGYFDINKNFDKDTFLCFAGSASSTLSWWFSQNNELINEYISKNPNIPHIEEIKKFSTLPTNQYDSNIFNHFTDQYAYRTTGYWPDLLIDHFLNGYKPKENAGVNDEDWIDGDNLINNGPALGGGFFFDLFGKRKLTTRNQVNFNDFNYIIKDTLANDGIISMTYDSSALAHVVTVWGAEIDNNGIVKAVYFSDSDDDKLYGLKRIEVYNKNGNAYITTDTKHKYGSMVTVLNTLRLGQEYFGVHNHHYGEPIWNLADVNNVTATFTCKDDSSHKEIIKANVESFIDESSCNKVGKSYKIATVAFNNNIYKSKEFDVKQLDMKDHVFTDYIIEMNPTCTQKGLKSRSCINCNYKETIELEILNHISDNIYHYENDKHFNLCQNGCNTKLNIESCHGGKATINKKAICEVCNHEYGKTLENNEIIIENNKLNHNIDNNNDLIININNNLLEIKLNNEILNKKYYYIEDKKLIIKNEYLKNLKKENNIYLQYEDGYVNIKLNILTNETPSKNNNNIIPIVTTSSILVVLLLIGSISFFIYKKKEK